MKRVITVFDAPWSTRVSLVIVALFLFVAAVGPWIAPYAINDTSGDVWEGISKTHLFGTDSVGRDILSRLMSGAQITLIVAGSSTVLAFFVGTSSGIVASIAGKWVDHTLSRLVDLLMSIPTLIFALIVLAIVPVNLLTLVWVMAILDSTRVFRLARSLAGDIAVMEYVEAAKLRGESSGWIVVHEILPNMLAPLIAEFALRFSFAILFLSALSFLGLGVQPPYADWGSLVRENKDGIIFGVPAALIPGSAIAILTIAVNTIADRLINQTARFRRDGNNA
jgi:peptide/nickel transport system permease protein